jgi:hypothetical protein
MYKTNLVNLLSIVYFAFLLFYYITHLPLADREIEPQIPLNDQNYHLVEK